MAEYSDREDIDKLLKTTEKLKYFARYDEEKVLATIDEVTAVSSDLREKYYDISQTYDKDEIDSLITKGEFKIEELTVTYSDESTETLQVLLHADKYSMLELNKYEDGELAGTMEVLIENNVDSRRYSRDELDVVEFALTYTDLTEQTFNLLVRR